MGRTVKIAAIKCSTRGRGQLLPRPEMVLTEAPPGWPLRPPQQEAIDKFGDEKFVALAAPTAFGKTLVCEVHVFDTLSRYDGRDYKHPSFKALITVPQTPIAANYKHAMLPGNRGEWLISETNDFCPTATNEAEKARRLIENFLKAKIDGELCQRAAICTHSLLVRVYRILEKEGRLDLLNDLLIWVDEAHHSAADYGEDIDGLDETLDEMLISTYRNGLGEVLMSAYRSKTGRIGMMSGSFFRDDHRAILPKKIMDKFCKYERPYDLHLADMEHLKNFGIYFMYYPRYYAEEIVDLLEEHKKTIVYLPHPQSGISSKDKYADERTILDGIGAKGPDKNGIWELPDGRRLMSLVNDDGSLRNRQKAFLDECDDKSRRLINTKPGSLDIIIAIGMVTEGFDWLWVERIVQVGPRAVQKQIQNNGRGLRDVLGKPNFDTVILLPEASTIVNKDTKKETNRYIQAIHMAMLLMEIYDPIDVGEDGGEKNMGRTPSDKVRFPPELIGEFLLDAVPMARSLLADGQSKGTLKRLFIKNMAEHIRQSGSLNGTDFDPILMARKIWAMCCNQRIPPQDSKVVPTGINFLDESTDPISGMRTLLASIGMDGEGFGRIRSAVESFAYFAFDRFKEIVDAYKINSSSQYKYLCLEEPHLPPNPAREYPGKFNNWDEFRSELNLKEIRATINAEDIIKNGIRGQRHVRRTKPPPPKPDAVRYKDYCREKTRTKLAPMSFADFCERK